MAFFQETVLHTYLQAQDIQFIQAAYTQFKATFLDEVFQANVKASKEEQYQEGFLNDLFVKVFEHILNPQPNFNLITEQKNASNSKKADGAILHNGEVIAVIELKGTETTDLSKVEAQAFGYKNQHKNCSYVIISNFEKLRFYIENSIEYIEFDLFHLEYSDFATLWICLSWASLQKDIPKQIKNASVSKEENITKQLYKDYSAFRRFLFDDLVKNNPHYEPLVLFKKTQKLLDRFLFIFFAEDCGLVQPNFIRGIIRRWQNLCELDAYVPLYSLYQKNFGYLNTGHKDRDFDIYAYNGGLFKPDEVLDDATLKISDDLLKEHTQRLSDYNFKSDVDVNILGHIFENSLNEIEEMTAEIQGQNSAEKSTTKRKKDGVFYTPKYITKYIVDNTLGKLCSEQKQSLELFDELYNNDKKKTAKTKKELVDKLTTYRTWLLGLKVCDPACGSGAFLNQALDFLISEHRYIDELQAKLYGDGFVLSDIENSILENNLYGVDINQESVEIAKLSLWLRTAQRNRKLNNLNQNIKCGNSLIDDPEVAGELAFCWEKEFPDVFEKGGFDVVIGNPPYGASLNILEKKYCKIWYPSTTEGKIDTYKIFFEKSDQILKNNGILSFITPNTFLYNIQSKKLRELILTNYRIDNAIELRKNIFEDAPDVVTVILTIIKTQIEYDYTFKCKVAYSDVIYNDIESNSFEINQMIPKSSLLIDDTLKINLRGDFKFFPIKQKLSKFNKLSDFLILKQGTKPYGEKTQDEKILLSNVKHSEEWEPALNGRNISRYLINFEDEFVLRSTELHSCLAKNIVENEKIYFQRMRKISLFPRIIAVYDDSKYHGLYTCSVMYSQENNRLNLKYILGLLNSKLINVWYKNFDTDIEIKLASVKEIPIVVVEGDEQSKIVNSVDLLMNLKLEYKKNVEKFITFMKEKLMIDSLNPTLSRWTTQSFADFIKELNKVIKASNGTPLSKKDEFEWMELFESQKAKALELKAKIDQTDKEIDQMVYELYGLTAEEIKIVEGAV